MVMDKERVICDRQGNLWLYNGKIWFGIDKDGLRSKVFEHDEQEKQTRDGLLRRPTLSCIACAAGNLLSGISWSCTEVPFQNGVLDFRLARCGPIGLRICLIGLCRMTT